MALFSMQWRTMGYLVQRNNRNRIYDSELAITTLYTTREKEIMCGAETIAHVIGRGWITAMSVPSSVTQQIFVVTTPPPSGKRMVGNKNLQPTDKEADLDQKVM